jgi:hypothetical protein
MGLRLGISRTCSEHAVHNSSDHDADVGMSACGMSACPDLAADVEAPAFSDVPVPSDLTCGRHESYVAQRYSRSGRKSDDLKS